MTAAEYIRRLEEDIFAAPEMPTAALVPAPRDRGCVPVHPLAADAVLALIMSNSPSTEALPLSVSRLSRAVGYMGYPCVSTFAAWLAYRRFPKLKEPYNEHRRTNKRT